MERRGRLEMEGARAALTEEDTFALALTAAALADLRRIVYQLLAVWVLAGAAGCRCSPRC